MEFRRPDNLPFPQIYKEFEVNGEEFVISELTEEFSEKAWQLLANFVIPEETFAKAKRMSENSYAMNFMFEGYVELFKQKISLACFKKSNNELVGINVLGVKTRGVENKRIPTDFETIRWRESAAYTSKLYDVFDKHPELQHYLQAFGLGVIKEYRGKGIAVELLKARVKLMQDLGLTMTKTEFSTLSSQKSAVKAGYKEVNAISYKELAVVLPDFDFSEANGLQCKTFILEVL